MPFRKVWRAVALVGDVVKTLTWDAFKTAASYLFEPTYRVRGHVKLTMDTVRVQVNPAGYDPTREREIMTIDPAVMNAGRGSPGKMRGGKPTPRHQLAAAMPFVPVEAPPAQFARVPAVLSYWGNNQYGDCVTAEAAFCKACWSPEIDLTDETVIQWAARHGVLNGADLGQVCDMMNGDGFKVAATRYDEGPKLAVDYSNEQVLQAAIVEGPVKIAIDADALPANAGGQSGWFATFSGNYGNTDHCVSLSVYGTAAFVFESLGLPVPASLDPTTPGYGLFTWKSIGFVTHAWLMSTCVEAWLRDPSTVVVGPTPPPPPPPPPAPPTPVIGNVGSLVVTQALQPGTYPIAPGLALVVGKPSAVDWRTILSIIIAILNGLIPIIPTPPPPAPAK